MNVNNRTIDERASLANGFFLHGCIGGASSSGSGLDSWMSSCLLGDEVEVDWREVG